MFSAKSIGPVRSQVYVLVLVIEAVIMLIDGQNHKNEEDDELVEVPWLPHNEKELKKIGKN